MALKVVIYVLYQDAAFIHWFYELSSIIFDLNLHTCSYLLSGVVSLAYGWTFINV